MVKYIKRVVDDEIDEYLQIFGAIAIQGPKWCGKTTTGRAYTVSEISMADPTADFAALQAARLDPASALKGATPRLIDEWQEVPKLWDAVRFECDQKGEPGLFVLTGSSTPRDDMSPMHSGAGRIAALRMDTMTLWEMGISNGETSLVKTLQGNVVEGCSGSLKGLEDIAELICRGGWPSAVNLSTRSAMLVANQYIQAVCESEVSQADGTHRDPDRIRTLLTSLARNESTLASTKTIAVDAGNNISRNTVTQYLTALKRIFLIDDIPVWNPALRSPVRLRSGAKHHLCDASIAAAAIGADPGSLAKDPKTLGLLFESLALHDLKVYAQYFDANVYHYHDDTDLEVDAIVAQRNGTWAAFEIKLGTVGIDDGCANLVRLEKKMIEHGEQPPIAKCVVVGFGAMSHVTDDGIYIVPIDTLAP